MRKYEVSVPSNRERPVRLATRTGASVVIQPGEKRQVRPALAKQAKRKRGVRVEEVQSGSEPAATQQTQTEPGVDRQAETFKAVQALVQKSDPADFTTQGRPKKTAVRKLVDFEVDVDEIEHAFQQTL